VKRYFEVIEISRKEPYILRDVSINANVVFICRFAGYFCIFKFYIQAFVLNSN